jgi:hypothetical protein
MGSDSFLAIDLFLPAGQAFGSCDYSRHKGSEIDLDMENYLHTFKKGDLLSR